VLTDRRRTGTTFRARKKMKTPSSKTKKKKKKILIEKKTYISRAIIEQ